MLKTLLSSALAACFLLSASLSPASDLLYSQVVDGQSVFGPSDIWNPAGVNKEIADDFNLVANIDRVVASGFVTGSVTYQGVHVRFYAYNADNTPGALLKEYFVATGYNAGTIDVPLSPAFAATGKHFISVQPVLNGWYWWSAHSNAPSGPAFWFRDLAIGQTVWQHGDNLNFSVNADVAFDLYGTTTGAGTITSLSATTLARSGYLEINGTNFGSNGTVLIDGISALVADWQGTKIVAYVPETARFATVPVQVVTTAGASNTVNLTVTARVAAGRVNWRFRKNAPYSFVRPAIGPDGTLYVVDVFAHLYAIAPDGGLKWLVRGVADKGVAVGLDGTIYTASENDVKAFNPDGSAKWTFVQTPRAFNTLGIAVGPDGNIYVVSFEGMGVFSLTPAGTLRWQTPEPYVRPIINYGEIVFGPNGSSTQLYFFANGHLRALKLDGTPGFLQSGGQPAVAPNGSIHTSYSAYAPSGSLLWTFDSPYPNNTSSTPSMGSDGTHYFVQNTIEFFALNPDGSQRWHRTLGDYFGGPVVNPANTQLILGGVQTLNFPGYIVSASTQDGQELWRVPLPAEDGFNQTIDTRARFNSNGTTAYVNTLTATGDNNTSRSFLYALDATTGSPTPTPTPAPTLRVASINLAARIARNVKVTAKLAVKDGTGHAVDGVAVRVNWQTPSGGPQAQLTTTNAKGQAAFNITDVHGTYTITVTDLTDPGYTFDPAHSILTKSITVP